jgi:hypothetical protein
LVFGGTGSGGFFDSSVVVPCALANKERCLRTDAWEETWLRTSMPRGVDDELPIFGVGVVWCLIGCVLLGATFCWDSSSGWEPMAVKHWHLMVWDHH